MHGHRRILALVSVLAAAAGAGAADDFESLLNNSPFNPGGTGAPAAVADTLELRGIVVEDGRPSLNIYDTATKKAVWVALDEPGHPFLVRSFDAATDTATIEVNRRSLSLPLKRAAVQLAAAVPVAPVPVPVGVAPVQPGAAVNQVSGINPSTGATPDQARLQAIADEIRRRRALRAQNQAQQTGNTLNVPRPTNVPASNRQRN